MGIQGSGLFDLRRTLLWSVLMGAAASILTLMLGLFFQTVFYEIASNIPSIIRQDAHITLPLCKTFPDLYGCDAWVGALTGLEIWVLSLQIGQLSGLLVNLILIAIFSMWVIVRARSDRAMIGLLTGIAGFFFSLALALAVDVPLNVRSPWGIFGILMLLLLPVSGYVGGRMGKDRLARRMAHRAVYILPVDEAAQMDWSGEELSKRELEVLALVAEGLQNREIAQRLYISKATVKTHLIHIFTKLRVENRTAAVTRALACGLLRKEEKDAPQS
jgi:DNA-binding CsgD family transcriptional regulator